MPPRRAVQVASLLLVAVAVFWVGANAELWCPFGGVEALFTYLEEGNLVCSLGVSNFYILGAVLLSVLLVRRAFCGYLCPIGALSEWARKGAERLGVPAANVPRGLERVLSVLKYCLLGGVLYLTWRAGELVFRGFDPCYALISRHGEDITLWAYAGGGSILLGSIFVSVPFCRWLCPLAAVLNPFSRFAAARVKRRVGACTGCGECTRACFMGIPVHELREVTAARCTSCLDCIDSCRTGEEPALQWGLAERRHAGWARVPGGEGRRARRRGGRPREGAPVPGSGTAPPRPWKAMARRPGRRAAVVAALLLPLAAAVSAAYIFPLPSFTWNRGEVPGSVSSVLLEVEGLSCRGRAQLLVHYLQRDDELEIPGYLRVEAWPGPGAGEVRVFFDAERADSEAVKTAITEPCFDHEGGFWRSPPLRIRGYDPLGIEALDPGGTGPRCDGSEGGAALEAALRPVVESREAHRIPIRIGELSAIR